MIVITENIKIGTVTVPLSTYPAMKRLAQVYIREIVKLHGVPESIVSDRDPRFQSRFWRSLSATMGTKLQLSTVAHPKQMDNQRGPFKY